jgi:pimeloyl-ACP methyl ester carboxylesterase
VVVWLPPEYGQPAYVHRSFPVVELLGGFPANVFGWMHGADVVSAYYRARAAGMPPAILVAAEINVEGATDLECLDAPGHPAVETWVTRDVPAFIQAHFRAARPGGWGIMGFSLGGFCAPYLALTHPEVYAAAVAINGYFAASSAQLPAAFLRDHSVLQAVRSRPAVSILWTTTRRDTSSPTGWGKILQKAAAPPTQVVVEIVDGVGHGTKQWRPFVWSHLRWLVARLPRA